MPSSTLTAIVALAVLLQAGAARAADPCTGFKWDVTREHSLFAGHGTSLAAGKEATSAPIIGTDLLYDLKLVTQTKVTFAATPGKKMLADGAYAGLATLRLAAPGNYRVAVDVPVWLDLVTDGQLAATRDFQGQRGCDAPHKIVEFNLSGARQFVLQVSGAASPSVRLTVTQASTTPPPPPG